MKVVARFVTRPLDQENRPTDIALMTIYTGQTELKPHTIYEIKEVLGVLTIVEVGPSGVSRHVWGKSIADIMQSMPQVFFTAKEWEDIVGRTHP